LKPWAKGVSGNPGGRPKRDLAAEVAKLVFEGLDQKQTAKAWAKAIQKNPKMFQVLADRAYGRVKHTVEAEIDLRSLSDEELEARLAELQK